MSVRCKFHVLSVLHTVEATYEKGTDGVHRVTGQRDLHSVKMAAVYHGGDPNHENAKFWKATPSGVLEFGTVNAEAVKDLHPGREYYIDITPA